MFNKLSRTAISILCRLFWQYSHTKADTFSRSYRQFELRSVISWTVSLHSAWNIIPAPPIVRSCHCTRGQYLYSYFCVIGFSWNNYPVTSQNHILFLSDIHTHLIPLEPICALIQYFLANQISSTFTDFVQHIFRHIRYILANSGLVPLHSHIDSLSGILTHSPSSYEYICLSP